jgi:hypothetical protein
LLQRLHPFQCEEKNEGLALPPRQQQQQVRLLQGQVQQSQGWVLQRHLHVREL